MRPIILAMLAFAMVACSGGDPRYAMEPQQWGDVVIKVESQPSPVRVGMNEFLILATTERGRPVFDMIISLRADHGHKWQQGIQDGHSGVYRKAVMIPEGSNTLYVQLRKLKTEEGKILEFPLSFGAD